MSDWRQFYRVRLDAELEAGVADAWERYQRAAELCVRAPEEWCLPPPAPASSGVQELRIQTMLGAVEIVPSAYLAGSHGYLIAGRIHLPPPVFTRLSAEAALGGGDELTALYDWLQPRIQALASRGLRLTDIRTDL